MADGQSRATTRGLQKGIDHTFPDDDRWFGLALTRQTIEPLLGDLNAKSNELVQELDDIDEIAQVRVNQIRE